MTTQAPTNETVSDTSQSPDLGSLSFADYQAARRGEKVESKPESAPVEETEQKAAAKSDPAETEEEGDESEAKLDEESDEAEDSDKPKKKGGFKRRIDKLSARVAERERELEYWKSQAMKNGATETPKEAPKVETKQAVEGKPSPDNFETHAEYVEALTDWKLEQREAKAKQEAEKSKLLTEQEAKLKSHQERVKAFADKTEDFMDVIENLADVRSVAVEQIILESENGPELLYALAKDPAEAKRICALPPLAAAREMGKLELKLSSQSSEEEKQEPKKLTSAPKPIEPVGSSKGQVRRSIADPNISFSDYVELRRNQMKRRR